VKIKFLEKIPKNVKTLGIVSFFNDASTDMIYPLIPLFLTKYLGATLPMVGLIEGLAESTASLMKVFSGFISDKLRRRKPLTVIGYSMSMVAKPFLAFATAPWHVLIVRFLDRIGKGVRQAPRDALIAESTAPAHLGLAYGFHKMMDTLGAFAGPLLAVVLLPILNENLRSLFLLSFVASALAVTTLVIFVKEKPAEKQHSALPKLSIKLLPTKYRWFLLSLSIFTIGNSSDAFLFLRAQNLATAVYLIPVLYALSNAVFAGLASYFGKLADKIGPYKIITMGYLVFAFTYFCFGAAQSAIIVWLLFPLYGVFSAMTDGVQKVVAAQIGDPRLKGTMIGLMHTTLGVFQLPASVIAGLLWAKIGVGMPFYFGGITALISAVMLLTVFRKN
jgi:MFS family permease